MSSDHKYLGIDFSGNQRQWNPNVQRSNIWIATIESKGEVMNLTKLRRVQQLQGTQRPFAQLAAGLSDRDCAAAAIDAPFSIPWWCFGTGLSDHPGLLETVNNLPLSPKQDFPTGREFIAGVTSGVQFQSLKPLRTTECYWQGRGINVRSTLWAGVRPGAPFASACIKLLVQSRCPIWPWMDFDNNSLLIEAFPAAQLCHWRLPFREYDGPSGQANRDKIILDLVQNRGLHASGADLAILKESADALDSVLCSYAARAVVTGQIGVKTPPSETWQREGWIAIHG